MCYSDDQFVKWSQFCPPGSKRLNHTVKLNCKSHPLLGKWELQLWCVKVNLKLPLQHIPVDPLVRNFLILFRKIVNLNFFKGQHVSESSPIPVPLQGTTTSARENTNKHFQILDVSSSVVRGMWLLVKENDMAQMAEGLSCKQACKEKFTIP